MSTKPDWAAASSYLFVPANRPERYAKALQSGADAVIVDLEDAVAPSQKEAARATLAHWLQEQAAQPRIWVRINAADTVWHQQDLLTFSAPSLAGIVLPKAEDAVTVASVAAHLGAGRRLIALIESAAGLAAMRQIAAVPGVQRLAFGAIDAQLDLGMQCGPQEEELMPLRVEMVMASRLARIAPPIDGVTTAFNDDALLARMVQQARRLGFGAKLCIHPRQVDGVRHGFMPSEQELAWAEEVMAAVRASDDGAISFKGKMIDKPVILQAEQFLRVAGRWFD
ncbi:citrate lyase subunit beta/citryl-CoA lyase [Herbaspirillum rubrisubalbicans]|uniref:HpcH/HpaI aldolase/citrate lyase family protein n=1 Tax=Herbaspirillum rubrisubalbicans TaxID=80842 RepID=UPI0020A059A9|nr:CoA ester lyase [Herbaspirillum rubrisubalbicans]MCP1573173.1 citrate lyase subunit beta/citryl-CoA lyase [Herbaspirillum rubrisubalbicans]